MFLKSSLVISLLLNFTAIFLYLRCLGIKEMGKEAAHREEKITTAFTMANGILICLSQLPEASGFKAVAEGYWLEFDELIRSNVVSLDGGMPPRFRILESLEELNEKMLCTASGREYKAKGWEIPEVK